MAKSNKKKDKKQTKKAKQAKKAEKKLAAKAEKAQAQKSAESGQGTVKSPAGRRTESEGDAPAAQTARPTRNMQSEKTPMPTQPSFVRIGNFDEVAQGYTLEMAVNEAQRCLSCTKAPCEKGCPVGVPIRGFIELVAQERIAEAYALVKEANSLPAICGRVCPQETQCEGNCTRGRRGEPVGIGYLERFVADWAAEHSDQAMQAVLEREAAAEDVDDPSDFARKSVACVGSGPASLTCAGELAKHGIKVTVFEALHTVGGVLAYGIPEFRLPKHLIAREAGSIRELGVDFQVNHVIGRIYDVPELLGRCGFDAVFIGTGAGAPTYMNIPGEALDGVMAANELLTRVNLMKAYRFPEYDTPVYMGRQCIVIGGGNVAMDAARTARRLGAEVTVVYRRSREEMPARDEEIAHAREEGIEFEFLTGPSRIVGNEDGWVKEVRCLRMELGETDASGRRRPHPILESEFSLPADTVVIAVGSKTNPLIQQTTPGLEFTDRNLIVVDEETGATTLPGVFAGGDSVIGAATVIRAMGAGKRAAAGIMDYLRLRKAAPIAER
ncbi:MAG: NADPH-dependent glutamate synthase [Eggerthellaceae bacterium]|jgi:glutamate synthase (NADPH/NADH) small chain